MVGGYQILDLKSQFLVGIDDEEILNEEDLKNIKEFADSCYNGDIKPVILKFNELDDTNELVKKHCFPCSVTFKPDEFYIEIDFQVTYYNGHLNISKFDGVLHTVFTFSEI